MECVFLSIIVINRNVIVVMLQKITKCCDFVRATELARSRMAECCDFYVNKYVKSIVSDNL